MFCGIYFYAHTGEWPNNQQVDGGQSAVEVEVETVGSIALAFKTTTQLSITNESLRMPKYYVLLSQNGYFI